MMKICIGSVVPLALAMFGTTAQAEPKPNGSVTLPGSYPGYEVTLPEGSIAFTAYAEDGNRRAVHVLDGATLRRTTILPQGRELAVLDDTVVIARYRGFDIYDAKSATLLKHKQFTNFQPPLAGANSHWLEGNILTLIQNETYADSSLRRVRLPQLEVIERFDAPVTGAFTRWNDRIVAIGYLRGSNGLPRPSIVVLDSNFRVVAHSDIEPSRIRDNGSCSVAVFAKPLVMGDLLVYGSDCGGMRVHDLKSMRQVAARGPLGAALFVTFASVDGRLLATGIDNESASIDEIELPSLRPTPLLRVSGKRFATSGANLYAFREPASGITPRQIIVDVYSAVGREAEHSLSVSILDAQRAALSTWQKSHDIAAAIAFMRRAIPRLTVSDVQSLTPAAMRAVAWYTGLLAQTPTFTNDAAQLVEALRATAADDSQIRALADAASTWIGSLKPPKDAATIPVSKSTFTTGALNGVIARTPDQVLAARWCDTASVVDGSRIPDPPAEPNSAVAALAACFRGEVSIAVHDARDLHFQRYIPIIKSEDTDQENIDAILLFRNLAVISIGRRYPDPSLDSLVSVDLRTGAVMARSKWILQTDPMPTKAIACLGSACVELDPKALQPGTSPIADGVALDSAPPSSAVEPPGSPYIFAWRDERLEARDRVSNEFVCAWPVFLKGRVVGLFHNPQDNTLVVEGTSHSLDDLTPSAIISVPTLIARSQDCGRETAKNKAALDQAIRTLQ